MPEPQRVVCGQRAFRQFDDDDLRMIRRIKGHLDAGFRLDVAAEKAATEILIEKGGAKNA